MLYHTLKKVRHGEKNLDYLESKQFIEIRYVQRVVDYNRGIDEEYPILAKICDHDDFNWNEEAEHIHSSLPYQDIVRYCPDLESIPLGNVQIQGTLMSDSRKQIEFQVL
jgi:hypothetical protein